MTRVCLSTSSCRGFSHVWNVGKTSEYEYLKVSRDRKVLPSTRGGGSDRLPLLNLQEAQQCRSKIKAEMFLLCFFEIHIHSLMIIQYS